MLYYNNRGKSTVFLERHVFLQNMIPERKYTFSSFISDHQGINIRAMFFPPFQKISIGKAGGGASYCCQMFWLSHYESRCCIQAVLCYSWQELTQIKLCTTLSDGDEFGLCFFYQFLRALCVAIAQPEMIQRFSVTGRPFGVYFHEPQWRPHAAVRFVLNLCFTVTKPSSSAFDSELYPALQRGVLYIIHVTLVFTTCEVLDKCVIRKQYLL